MIENVKVKIMDQVLEVAKGTSLEEIAKQFQNQFKYDIILAKVDGFLKELNEVIDKECQVEFLDLTNRAANRVYLNGLIYLTIYSAKELYGNKLKLRVLHGIDKGLYIETSRKVKEEEVMAIEKKMREVVAQKLTISKLNVDRIDAINYFKSIGDMPKSDMIRYNTNTYITLYKLGNMYSYLYSLMPINTSVLSEFELTCLNNEGLVLRYPTVYINDKIKEYVHHEKLFEVFRESREWERVMNLQNVSSLNQKVSFGNISEIIRIDETLQSNRLLSIARKIESNKKNVKIVLLSGPSSSGKTTTTKKLSMYLRSMGLKPIQISMDDYFKERENTPLGEDGKPDFECLEAVDLKLFDKQISELLAGKEVKVPTFNFLLGMKEFKDTLKMEDGDILLIEGIHALNKSILTNIPKENKFKIYLSALTSLNIDDHNRISTSDNRLLRRIVRDNRTRGYKVEKTLEAWSKVRAGEEKYVFPYQDDADIVFNTALIYELGVLKTYVEPLLYSVDEESEYYNEAKRLINFLKVFLPIGSEDIPDDSILREFIGRGCYHN